MKNPYVVKVPPGVEEIDLRPALEPLVLQIVAHMRNRDSHDRQERHAGAVDMDAVHGFLNEAAIRLEVTRLAEHITRADIVRILPDLGWTPEDDYGVRWNLYRNNWLTVPRPDRGEDLSLTTKLDLIQTMGRQSDGADRVAFVRSILAKRSVLDGVAWAAEE